MSTYIGYPSDLDPRLQIASRVVVPAKGKKQGVASSHGEAMHEAGGLFENSLLVSGENSRRRNPWAAFGSVSLQLLLLATVVLVPLFHTDLLPKREMLTMLYLQPPAAAGASTRFRTPPPRPNYSSVSTAPIAPVPKAQEASATAGVVGGIPGGTGIVPGGLLGDVLGSTPSVPVLAKAPAVAPKRIRLAQRIVEANLIHDVTPTYPPEAGRARIQGTVVLVAVIGKDGSVEDVRIESGLPILAQAAMDAVKQWRYRPYLLNGEPVEVDSRITINFALSAT